jgi:hypothetical protein
VTELGSPVTQSGRDEGGGGQPARGSRQYDVYVSAPSSGSSSPAAGASSATASSAAGASPGAAYISKLQVAAGDTIRNGQQLAELDGQPLFALTGPVPAWRDLTRGERPGRDRAAERPGRPGLLRRRGHGRALLPGDPGRLSLYY